MRIFKNLLALALMAAVSAFAGNAFAGDWVIQLGGGISQPLSKQLSDNYSLGYNGSIALGYKASSDFTLSINSQVNSLGIKSLADIDNTQLPYDSSHPTVKSASFDSFQVSAIGKLYLMGVAALRPYVFAGPGIAFNAYHLHLDFPGDHSSFQTDYATVESDFFATGGVGAELDLSGGLSVFAQAQFALDVTKAGRSNIIADAAATPGTLNSGSTSYYLPITAGINYNL